MKEVKHKQFTSVVVCSYLPNDGNVELKTKMSVHFDAQIVSALQAAVDDPEYTAKAVKACANKLCADFFDLRKVDLIEGLRGQLDAEGEAALNAFLEANQVELIPTFD